MLLFTSVVCLHNWKGKKCLWMPRVSKEAIELQLTCRRFNAICWRHYAKPKSRSSLSYVPEALLHSSRMKKNYDALLCAWYGGEQAGTAVADVLFGDYNPAGRLPITF